jgi:hypothetical protein
MHPAALAALFLSAIISGAAFGQGASPPASAPRSVGSGITMVPGAAGTASAPPPQAQAAQPAPAKSAAPAPPSNPTNVAAEAVDRREEFIRRSVMQSICRGC